MAPATVVWVPNHQVRCVKWKIVAKKKKLTKGQVRRVRSNQNKRLKKEDSIQWDENMLGSTKSGLVITRFGQHADIEDLETIPLAGS